ncbi:MAG: hypothetical protein KatS3mg077_2643 [Candidatus Binatia bacterium]|nr:MAG: hypothetical protein KatS3mg077_2643 [Candidatus Binatia bacterium]
MQVRLVAMIALSWWLSGLGRGPIALATELENLDREYGFRGVAFGADLDTVPGLKKIGERGECEIAYSRPGDRLEFDGVPLTSIEYSFQNDRFTLVSLLARDQDCARLYAALRKRYGEDQTKLGDEGTKKPFWTATWAGKRVKVDITGPTGCIVTISAPEEAILEERRCREDDRVKAGKGD